MGKPEAGTKYYDEGGGRRRTKMFQIEKHSVLGVDGAKISENGIPGSFKLPLLGVGSKTILSNENVHNKRERFAVPVF